MKMTYNLAAGIADVMRAALHPDNIGECLTPAEVAAIKHLNDALGVLLLESPHHD